MGDTAVVAADGAGVLLSASGESFAAFFFFFLVVSLAFPFGCLRFLAPGFRVVGDTAVVAADGAGVLVSVLFALRVCVL